MKNKMIGTYIDNRTEKDYNFEFYTNLSTSEKLKFTNTVTSLLVDGEDYNSVIRDLLFDFYLIDMMSEIDLGDLKQSPRFIDDVEQFLEETNIVDIIKANAETGLIDELNKSISLNIQYKTGIHPSPLGEALAGLVNTLEKKVNEIDLDGMMDMVNMFAGMTEGLTPENIVDAYMNSDTHKKNQAEIDGFKKLRAEFAVDMDKAIKEVTKKKKK